MQRLIMVLSALVGIDRSIKNACECKNMMLPNDDFSPSTTLIMYRLKTDTLSLPPPITGVIRGFFAGAFEREQPYQLSKYVTREQFDDVMMMCQCHEDSFADNDYYQEIHFEDFDDMLTFLGVDKKNVVPLEIPKKITWHIIENCGNFKSVTTEYKGYFWCCEMTTS